MPTGNGGREMESGLLNHIPDRETVPNRIRGGKRGPYCIQLGIVVNVTDSSDIAKQINISGKLFF